MPLSLMVSLSSVCIRLFRTNCMLCGPRPVTSASSPGSALPLVSSSISIIRGVLCLISGEYARGILLCSILALCLCPVAEAQDKLAVASPPIKRPAVPLQRQSTSTTSAPSIDDDPHWHFVSLSYLWLPGISGTVGAKGYSTRVAVSPADVLKHFNIGLMGSFEPQYKRWSLPIDFVWAKLSDSQSVRQVTWLLC